MTAILKNVSRIGFIALMFIRAFAQGGTSPNAGETHQRVEFLKMEFATRYAYADMAPGVVKDRQLEYRMSDVLRINLDGSGAGYVQFRGESGNSFNGSWGEAGVGKTAGDLTYNLKSLFVAYNFSHRVNLEAGGIEFDRGAGTEATYAANEAWLSGYRVNVNDLHGLPKRVGVTLGYVGDFDKPNFFSRADRLGNINYFQLIGQQPLRGVGEISLEANSLRGIGYGRAAFHTGSLPLRVVTDGTLEVIGRGSGYRTAGWSASVGRSFLRKHLSATFRYSDIPVRLFEKDGQQVFLNSGEIGLGRRGAIVSVLDMGNGLALEGLVARRLDNGTTTPRWRGFVAVHYDPSRLFNKVLRASIGNFDLPKKDK